MPNARGHILQKYKCHPLEYNISNILPSYDTRYPRGDKEHEVEAGMAHLQHLQPFKVASCCSTLRIWGVRNLSLNDTTLSQETVV